MEVLDYAAGFGFRVFAGCRPECLGFAEAVGDDVFGLWLLGLSLGFRV